MGRARSRSKANQSFSLRGEICVGFASLLSIASVVLLIFVHVGQINTTTVPRGISMLKVNMSAYSDVLETFIQDKVNGLYTSNPKAPLQAQAGLRQYYDFGLYSYCAFVSTSNNTPSFVVPVNATASSSSLLNSSSTPDPSIGPGQGTCSNHTFARPFKPYDYITSDMLGNYSFLSLNFIPDTTFRDSKYLSQTSKAAYWMLFLGTICAALALIFGFAKNHLTFFLSAIFSLASAVLLLVASSIWTVVIKKSESVNDILLTLPRTGAKIPLGIVVHAGSGLYILWAACVCMVLSVIPYFVSCCTWRG